MQCRNAPLGTSEFPAEWGEAELVNLPLDASEAIWLAMTIDAHCPTATLERVTRVQNRGLWQKYR